MAQEQEYDPENVFAKIIDGTIPCFKVYEDDHVLGFLDAFPMTRGHTLVVPKAKGYRNIFDLPDKVAMQLGRVLPQVARAVRGATGCDGLNIVQNNEDSAGQTVFHPHFHLIPRFDNDKLYKIPASASTMLTPEEASPVQEAIKAVLNRKVLMKPSFTTVKTLVPESKGINIPLQVVSGPTPVVESTSVHEVVAGDSSGLVTLSITDKAYLDACKEGAKIVVRNGFIIMIKGHMRLAVNKWGKLEKDASSSVEADKMKDNISDQEFVLMTNAA